MLNLLQDVDLIPTAGQIVALVELAALNYDTVPLDALQQAMELLSSIENQMELPSLPQDTNSLDISRLYGDIAAEVGRQAILGLARNRLINITVNAECVNQR